MRVRIVVNLLEQVRSAVDERDDAPERAFLRGGQAGGRRMAMKMKMMKQEPGKHHPVVRTEETSGSVLQQFLTSCLAFPKIRKISRCLNPLLVPVSMLMQRQQQLLKQEQGTNNSQ